MRTNNSKNTVAKVVRYLFLSLFALLQSATLLGQDLSLIVEGRGAKVKTEYVIGDLIEYRLKGESRWTRQVITGMHFETHLLFFENGSLDIREVDRVRHVKDSRISRTISRSLIGLGAQWLVAANMARLVDYEVGPADWIIPGGAILGGLLARWLMGKKVYRLRGLKRLRIRDVRWKEELGLSYA